MNKVTASSLLLVLQKVMERSVGLVSTLILARLLSPADFGVIAVAMLVLWFVETLTKAGADIYIIQKESVFDEEVNSAWTLDIILKNVSFLILILAAPLVAYHKDDSSLVFVIIAIGFSLPISSLKNPGLWLLKRDQNYSKIVKTSVFTKIIVLSVTIPAAYLLQSFWAIVIGQILSASFSVYFSYRISVYRPKISILHISTQWEFSKWIIPQEVIGYFRNHIDTLIVSSRFAISDLGGYNNMKYFSSIPMLQVITPLAAPLHAELGKVQSNRNEMRFQSTITVKLIGFIAAPFAVIGFLTSEDIVSVVLGVQWIEYSDVFSYFSLSIVPFILFTQASRILMVKGRTKDIFLYEIIATVITALVLIKVFSSNESIQTFSLYRITLEFIICTLFYFYANYKVLSWLNLGGFLTLIAPILILMMVIKVFGIVFFAESRPEFYFFIVLTITSIVIPIVFIFWYVVLASSREKLTLKKFSPF